MRCTLLRDDLVPATLDDLGEHAVGGGAAEAMDAAEQQSGRLALVLGFVLLLTMLIMAATFRSASLAIISTVLNLASIGAAFGVMTLVFQHGYGSGLPRLHQPRLHHRLGTALRARRPDRALDGLPRLRAQPGPRAHERRSLNPARGRARHRRHRRCRHQCRGGDGVDVRDLRDDVPHAVEDAGRRPRGRDPARRHTDPPRDAARNHGPARREGVVAVEAASLSARSWSRS